MISAYENVPDLLSRNSSVFQSVPSEEWSLIWFIVSMQHKSAVGRKKEMHKSNKDVKEMGE